VQEFRGLPRDARKRAEKLFNLHQVPAVLELRVKLNDRLLAFGVVELRAHTADDVIRPGQRLGLQQGEHIVHQPAGIVAQERAVPPREPSPRFLEAAGGLGIAEQRAVEIRGE